jgi:Fe2+ transport system protein B
MTCSARLPVYVLVTLVLFPKSPALAALAFVGCYALGILAGVLSALIARRTILRGKSRPMALELPSYKRPSVRTALLTTYDRGMVFLKKAGTNIMAICIVLWWLGAYPHGAPPAEAVRLREQAIEMTSNGSREMLDSRRNRGLSRQRDLRTRRRGWRRVIRRPTRSRVGWAGSCSRCSHRWGMTGS